MKFHEFAESLYVSTNIENQTNYHPRLASKIQAIQSLINIQKWWLKVFAYPAILFHYLEVVMGVKSALPQACDVVKLYNEQKKAEQDAKELLEKGTIVPEIQ